MHTRRTGFLAVALLLVALGGTPLHGQESRRQPPEKLRILVDKVLMADNDWVMTENHVAEIATAGFNVVSPRRGNEDMDEVRRIARLAGEYGMRHMPWMRGTKMAEGEERLVWAVGTEQEICSPNADELWGWMTHRIVQYARISLEEPALMGAFLDFENYWPGKQGWNGYPLSYDMAVMRAFAAVQDIQLPELDPAERYPWLLDNQLHAEFARFQEAGWRQRCRTLRQAVDAVNPDFQLCVYPAPGTRFCTEAIIPEWGTPQAPLILADASNYGRPPSMLPNKWLHFEPGIMRHDRALDANRQFLQARQASVSQDDAPLVYLGGIDPVVPGADPEFCGKNALMSAEVTDGYWVFYEGPEYSGDHSRYFRWFFWANQAIADARYSDQYEPRQTPDPWGRTQLDARTRLPQLGMLRVSRSVMDTLAAEGRWEVHQVRGTTYEYLSQFDVLVLGDMKVDLDYDSNFVQLLRRYVGEGGGLMVTHDTIWFMASPVPAVAKRPELESDAPAGPHVVGANLVVRGPHPALPDVVPGTRFSTAHWDHAILAPGPEGTVLVANQHGDPVCIAGELGAGQIVFSGCYVRRNSLEIPTERRILMACLDWLAQD